MTSAMGYVDQILAGAGDVGGKASASSQMLALENEQLRRQLARKEDAYNELFTRFTSLQDRYAKILNGGTSIMSLLHSSERKVLKEIQELRALMAMLQPYVDTMVCYASTLDEHEGNRVAKAVDDYFEGRLLPLVGAEALPKG